MSLRDEVVCIEEATIENTISPRVSNSVYASESIDALPSIQEGLDRLNVDKRELCIIGGRNEVSSTIQMSHSQLREIRRFKLRTTGGVYLSQPSKSDISYNIDIQDGY